MPGNDKQTQTQQTQGQQQQQTQTQVNQQNGPLTQQSPFYQQLWNAARSAFGQTNGQSGYFAPTATQQQGNAALVGAAPGLGTGVNDLRSLATSQLRGDWLNPNTNPYIKDVATAAINPVRDALTGNLHSIEDRAIAQGAYGGSRQDLQQNQALTDFNRTAGDITSGIYAQNYANERGIQQNSANLLDQANILALMGPQALSAAGTEQQGWGQAALNDKLSAPWRGLSEYGNILGLGGFGGTTGTTSGSSSGSSSGNGTAETVQQKDLFGQILQGLLGGVGLFTGMGGIPGIKGLFGMGGGVPGGLAVAGGAL